MSKAITILVVDDNPSMVNTMAANLAFKGYNVLAAHSGTEALEILHNQPVDILLTDVKMSDIDGVTLYRRSKEIHPNLTTFLMTAYAHNDLIQQGLAEGIKTVFTKPVDIDSLLLLLSSTIPDA